MSSTLDLGNNPDNIIRKKRRKSGAFGSNYLKGLENSLTKINKVNQYLGSEQSPQDQIEEYNETFNSRNYKSSVDARNNYGESFTDHKIKSSHRSTFRHNKKLGRNQRKIEKFQKKVDSYAHSTLRGHSMYPNVRESSKPPRKQQRYSRKKNYGIHNALQILSSTFT